MMDERVYAVKLKNEVLRQKSSSGGAFVAFAESILELGGSVYGAAWDKGDWSVRHRRVTALADLDCLQGTKYVPSDCSLMLPQVIEDLSAGRRVLVSGTPCQIAAIRSRFKNEERLLTVEVFCHGITEGKVWNFYKGTMDGGLVTINFKDKRHGWNNPTLVFCFADGHEREEPLYENPYVRAFMSGLSMRKGCFRCPFKSGKSGADISIGDYWGIESVHPEFADERGVSVVVVHTDKGREAWARITTSVDWVESSVEKFLPSNPNYVTPHQEPRNRDLFLRRYQSVPMGPLVTRCMEGPWIMRQVRRVYYYLRRTLCA